MASSFIKVETGCGCIGFLVEQHQTRCQDGDAVGVFMRIRSVPHFVTRPLRFFGQATRTGRQTGPETGRLEQSGCAGERTGSGGAAEVKF